MGDSQECVIWILLCTEWSRVGEECVGPTRDAEEPIASGTEDVTNKFNGTQSYGAEQNDLGGRLNRR